VGYVGKKHCGYSNKSLAEYFHRDPVGGHLGSNLQNSIGKIVKRNKPIEMRFMEKINYKLFRFFTDYFKPGIIGIVGTKGTIGMAIPETQKAGTQSVESFANQCNRKYFKHHPRAHRPSWY